MATKLPIRIEVSCGRMLVFRGQKLLHNGDGRMSPFSLLYLLSSLGHNVKLVGAEK